MRVSISTGGGDAPGLNAVIRSVVLSAIGRGWEVVGVERGFGGLLGEGNLVPLGRADVATIAKLGGTILGTTNRGNPFKWPVEIRNGVWEEVDRSSEVMRSFQQHELDALIVVGGDGSLRIAADFHHLGLPVVGVPKTIDNDVGVTFQTFGFDTAVSTATDAIDKLHSTAMSHSRVMVVELMGREAGWIALHAGLAGGAHVILIPEIPFHLESICRKIDDRERRGDSYSIVVAAEGAHEVGGLEVFLAEASVGGTARLGGIADHVALAIQERTGKETRSLSLGHLQRGGSPSAFDRILAQRFGAEAVRAVADRRFGQMVAYTPPTVTTTPLEEAIGRPKLVDIDGDTVRTAREIGISFGDNNS